eukprot:TRINITY_DN20336_c0_g1_i1.p1 TRINITY_DN20336_c0_g1~~TRINITY_DN20336_c0_g1_i1.p1  ORF type:complete len:405 (+),score=63.72 TRINITY_DN20336_c0_g1_i1:92-1216(+)
MLRSLVGSEMCIRDRVSTQSTGTEWAEWRELAGMASYNLPSVRPPHRNLPDINPPEAPAAPNTPGNLEPEPPSLLARLATRGGQELNALTETLAKEASTLRGINSIPDLNVASVGVTDASSGADEMAMPCDEEELLFRAKNLVNAATPRETSHHPNPQPSPPIHHLHPHLYPHAQPSQCSAPLTPHSPVSDKSASDHRQLQFGARVEAGDWGARTDQWFEEGSDLLARPPSDGWAVSHGVESTVQPSQRTPGAEGHHGSTMSFEGLRLSKSSRGRREVDGTGSSSSEHTTWSTLEQRYGPDLRSSPVASRKQASDPATGDPASSWTWQPDRQRPQSSQPGPTGLRRGPEPPTLSRTAAKKGSKCRMCAVGCVVV